MTNNIVPDFESQRETFRNRGVIRFNQFLPVEKVERACKAARKRMELAEIRKDGAWQVDHLRNAPINEGAKFVRRLKGCPEFDELVSGDIPRVVAQLLEGQETFTDMDMPQPLFTLPNANSWEVPHDNWHLDVPRLPDWGIPGVQVFTFLESVVPTGGGTLVVAGSHRLLNGSDLIRSRDVKRLLKNEPFFRGLMSKETTDRRRFIREVEHYGNVELQVVELFGEPGDVYFVDLRMLHTPAPNATQVPRIMLTKRFFLEAVRYMIYSDTQNK